MARMWVGVLAGVTVLGLALAGCSSSESASTTPQTTTYAGPPIGAPASPAPSAPASAAPSASAPAGAPAAPSASAAPAAPAGKVSANTASEEEIFSALSKAGVTNPKRWTDEVIEYRPYPANDPNLGKLRQNLAKYNPGQDTVDKIVSALTP
ncbi:MAG TPA: hypothetical protein VL595_05870 [Pseudonocardia sp.]|nr:hypothetical protein [Pseudonocardia sp.]